MKFNKVKKSLLCGAAMILLSTVSVRAESAESGESIAGTPIKVQVTCYCEPGKTANGSAETEGVIAGKAEWLNYPCLIYKVGEDGEIGDFIGIFEVADLGYGAPVEYFGEGSSERKKGRKAGTIETGLTIDFRQSSYANCVKFMKETMTGSGTTGSEVYALVVKGVG